MLQLFSQHQLFQQLLALFIIQQKLSFALQEHRLIVSQVQPYIFQPLRLQLQQQHELQNQVLFDVLYRLLQRLQQPFFFDQQGQLFLFYQPQLWPQWLLPQIQLLVFLFQLWLLQFQHQQQLGLLTFSILPFLQLMLAFWQYFFQQQFQH